MKHSTLTLASIFFLSMNCLMAVAQGKAVKENDTIICLKVIGLVTENDVPVDGIQISLFKENEELEWDEITSIPHHDHRILFNLLGNSYYSIKVSKSGYISRLVSVSTAIPDDFFFDGGVFKFEFEVELLKEQKGADDYYFDFPVALISYNYDTMSFENNANYTKHIKSKISEMDGQAVSLSKSTPDK